MHLVNVTIQSTCPRQNYSRIFHQQNSSPKYVMNSVTCNLEMKVDCLYKTTWQFNQKSWALCTAFLLYRKMRQNEENNPYLKTK